MSDQLANQVILDGFGHSVLVFSSDNHLTQSNLASATLLGADLNVIRSDGWSAITQLFDGNLRDNTSLDDIRSRALKSRDPIRFHLLRNGEYLPCWASALTGGDGKLYTMLTLDNPDWSVANNVLSHFRTEMEDAIGSTLGHINLITRTLTSKADDEAALKIAKRIGGFTKLIGIHMQRAERLVNLTERLEVIRMGKIRAVAQEQRQRIKLEDFIEDFMESLDNPAFTDPETEAQDHRSRIKLKLDGNLAVAATKRYLSYALQEILRNAIMYSLRGTPITLAVSTKGNMAQIDVADEGYGIQERDFDRVFLPFQRGRQPQVISEFGYGLALYLCKQEITAMNGKLWFTSTETFGTTFSVLLPLWQDGSSS